MASRDRVTQRILSLFQHLRVHGCQCGVWRKMFTHLLCIFQGIFSFSAPSLHFNLLLSSTLLWLSCIDPPFRRACHRALRTATHFESYAVAHNWLLGIKFRAARPPAQDGIDSPRAAYRSSIPAPATCFTFHFFVATSPRSTRSFLGQ